MTLLLPRLLVFLLSIQFNHSDHTYNEYITPVELTHNQGKTVRGYLSEGRAISNAWANNHSNVGCFPQKNNKAFNGHQILYTVEMPAYTALELRAISNQDISMYAFQVNAGDLRNVPPTVRKVIHCESSNHKGNGSKDPESIYLSTQSKACKVIIGIAGAEKIDKGAFDLRMNLLERKRP